MVPDLSNDGIEFVCLSSSVSCNGGAKVSVESRARSGGEEGRQSAHSSGRTCVHNTDFGPCTSQK